MHAVLQRKAGMGKQKDGGLTTEISKPGFIVFISFPLGGRSMQHLAACWAGPQM